MRNFNEYYKEYTRTHPITQKNRIKIKIKNNFFLKTESLILLFIPILLTLFLDLFVPLTNNEVLIIKSDINRVAINTGLDNLNSSIINDKYSEKIIIDESFENSVLPSNISAFVLKNKKIKTLNNQIINESNDSNDKIASLNLASSSWKNNFSKKKYEFINTVLPIIAFENKKIQLERNRLLKISKYIDLNKTLYNNDVDYLDKIAKKYLIKTKNKHKVDVINQLLESVNIIPNSIVLAQAVNESGWGSSRFAKEYNALFGEYTYDEDNGIIPYEREEGKKHLVRNFSSIDKSVESYFRNINTHAAYKKFREIRSHIGSDKLFKHVKLLTKSLDAYAEDELYIKTINSIIETNNFKQFDLLHQVFTDS